MTPLPHAASFAALNAALAERCRARQGERAGRHEETIGERLVRDLAALRGIPQGLFEPCEKKPAKVSSTGLVRYRMNDYSVPTRCAFQDVMVKGFVDEVVIAAGAEIIARHERIYGRNQFVFDPKHYLALLERKPGALDQQPRCKAGTCPRRSSAFAGCSRAAWAIAARRSSSRSCGCWRCSRRRSWPPVSCRRCSSARSASMRSSSSCWPASSSGRPGSI